MKRVLGGAGAAVAAKVLTGFAVVALGAAGAGAATEAALSGSVNPSDWGQQVKQQVATCKAALAADQHGIGQCVSAFASQHDRQVSAHHRATDARTNPGKGHDKTKDKSNSGNSGNNGNGKGNNGVPPGVQHGPPATA